MATLKCIMILGDCLDASLEIAPSCASLAYSDLPYSVSCQKWDKKVDIQQLWKFLGSVCCPLSAKVFSAINPFATEIICSQKNQFKYDLVWEKRKPTGFFSSKRAPLRSHELLLIFGNYRTYNPQMTSGTPYTTTTKLSAGSFYGRRQAFNLQGIKRGLLRFPKSVLAFKEIDIRTSGLNGIITRRLHPTQKPIEMLAWLIRTYSNPGDTVLDPVSGSFTTSVAACVSGRSSIGIEKDPAYFEAGVERVRKTVADNKLDVDIEVRG